MTLCVFILPYFFLLCNLLYFKMMKWANWLLSLLSNISCLYYVICAKILDFEWIILLFWENFYASTRMTGSQHLFLALLKRLQFYPIWSSTSNTFYNEFYIENILQCILTKSQQVLDDFSKLIGKTCIK